jgi:predicted GNAT family acetyltransferase
MTQALDRPIWHALTTRQKHIAIGNDRARRFAPDIGLFAATPDDSDESQRALANLIAGDDRVLLLQVGNPPLPPGISAELTADGVQMVADKLQPVTTTAHIERLTDDDAPEMLALATLTKPGPFFTRTHTLGTFWGVKHDGKLVAMAGERMKLTGYTEVSGVCTHPDARGKGYAAALSHKVASLIIERGETPFLHAYATNKPAIDLYKALGFTLRTMVSVTVFARG